MSEDVRLSVILPTHNGGEHIVEQLDALAEQRWDRAWEIVFLDNGSTDNTNDLLNEAVTRMPVPTRVVYADDHLSLSYARNTGVEAAVGRSVAFCDDDDIVADGWVAALGESLESHEFVASSFEYHRLNEPITASGRGSFQTDSLGDFHGVPVASGGGSGCRRDLWIAVGGNDLAFYRSGQDLDFSLRVHQHGVSPVLCRDAVYHVRLRSGLKPGFRQAQRFGEAAVALYRVHGRALDVERETVARTARRWLGLAGRSFGVANAQRRAKWVWQLGYRIGRIRGSVRERTWYL